jgi:hypothetical protein
MFIANATQIARFTGKAAYANGAFHDAGAAKVNEAVVAKSGGKLPCYATPGKRTAFKWVSVGSSCVIARGEATKWLAGYGVDINEVEAA